MLELLRRSFFYSSLFSASFLIALSGYSQTIVSPALPVTDLCSGGIAQTLTDITIDETTISDFSTTGGPTVTFVLIPPANFQFVPGTGTVTISGSDLALNATPPVTTSSDITITFDITNTLTLDYFTISGLQVTAITSSSSGNISRSAGISGGTFLMTGQGANGASSSYGFLSSLNSPSISTQPTNQTVCLSSSATFNVDAGVTSNPTYQWRKNGIGIVGANSSNFTIPSVVIGDADVYDVIVSSTNAGCNTPIFSATVTLTIDTPATITLQPTASQTLCTGSALNLSVTATGTALTYQWKKNGTNISVATTSSFSIASVLAGDAATYTVVVTSSGVCAPATVTSGNAVVIVNPIPVGTSVVAGTYFTCSGSALNITPSTNVSGSTFVWSGSNGSGGTGNITNAPINNGNTPIDITYTITPTGPSSTFCVGLPFTIVNTVNPNPTFTATNNTPTICSGTATSVSFASLTTGHRINVVSASYGAVTGGTVTAGVTTFVNGNTLIETLTNGTNAAIDVVYMFNVTTPLTTPNCPLTPVNQTVTVRVLPSPAFTFTNTTAQICSGSQVDITLNSLVAGAQVRLKSVNYGGATGTLSSGLLFSNGQKISEVLFNTTNSPVTVTYQFEAITGACLPSATQSTTVIVKPIPAFSITNALPQVCEGTANDITLNSPTSSAVIRLDAVNYNGAIGSLTVGQTFTNGQKITELLVNPTNNSITVTYTFSVSAVGCNNAIQQQTTVTTTRKPTVVVPANYIICEPVSYATSPIMLTGTIGASATTGLWSKIAGNGALSATNVSGSTVTANYIIDPTDVSTTVIFRLTSNDPDGPTSPCTSAFADINITINRAAAITAGIDLAQCKDQASITLQGGITYAPNGVLWSGGAGVFSANTNPTSNYSFANPSEISSTSPVTLTLTALDPDGVGGPCAAVADQMKLTINPLPVVAFFGLPPVMAENNPPIFLSGNQSGGLFTITPTPSLIGNLGPSPVLDKAVFDPSAAAIGFNTITYSYTDVKGCTSLTSQSVLINPVTTVDFALQYQTGSAPFPFVPINGLGEFEVCGNVGTLKIVGNPVASTGISPTSFTAAGADSVILASRISQIGVDFFINTNGLPSKYYSIRYTYTNSLGVTTKFIRSLKVFASPTAAISGLTNNCVTSSVAFTDASTLPVGSPFPPNPLGTTYSWKFGDLSSGQSGLQNPSYLYTVAGNYIVQLTVTTSQGCSSSTVLPIQVGNEPAVDFKWAAICTNDFTNFEDKTTKVVGTTPPGLSTITTYSWDFGDGNLLTNVPALGTVPVGTHGGKTKGTFKKPEHNYALPGTYLVTLNVKTNDGCSVTTPVQSVFILPAGVTVQPNSLAPYFKDFEANDGGWISEALKKPDGSFTLPPSWIYGTPSGNNIKTAASGNNAWWTGKNFLTPYNQTTYIDDESSAVNGPCFDLTQLHKPMVSLDYWSDAESNVDGAVLQYSTDGGLNWQLVGPLAGLIGTDRDQGINWYNKEAVILSNPGEQLVPYGWTGKSGKWNNGRFNLDMVDTLKRTQVRVRIAFASSIGNGAGNTYDGFAFDNFFIGEKKRNVLIEHFTNSSLTGSTAADTYLNGLYDKEINLRGKGDNDFNDIQYHISYSSANSDLLNTDNPNDPNARASSYGVSQPPKTFMDGIKNAKFDGNTTKLNNIEIDRRALKDPKFTLKLDTTATNKNNFINVQLTMTADTIVNVPLIAQVALVEEDVVTTAGTFKNVLRKLLYGSDATKPDGITITQAFTKGQTTSRPQPPNEVEINVPIKDPKKLKLIGFIQDKNTGEIYQSTVMKVKFKTNSPITGLGDDPLVISNLKDLQIYPNPANGKFNFALPGNFPAGYVWKIADQRGIFIMKGDFDDAVNGIKTVDVSSVINGVYFILIGAEGKVPVYKKLVVINQN